MEHTSITINKKDSGYRGIWYFNQPSGDEFVYKYSGGLGTYCAKHRPLAIYREEVEKTFFCYGGTPEGAHRRHGKAELENGKAFEAGENGSGRGGFLLHMVSYYDHKTGTVPRPTILLDKQTADAHDNPVLSIDDRGYLWIFSTSHGTSRPSYIHRSRRPYDIDAFDRIPADIDNFSYMQPWYVDGFGFLAFHTRYHNPVLRTIGVMTSKDGRAWSDWTRLGAIGDGHYQVSEVWKKGESSRGRTPGRASIRAVTAFNYHPDNADSRTNLYCLQTDDGGWSWTSAGGDPVQPPLTEVSSPALVHDYQTEDRLVYLKDIAFDAEGRPVVLYIVSTGFESGPSVKERTWTTARWTGAEWEILPITTSDSNYDTGSLYIEEDGTWRIIGPTETGAQPYNPGGEMAMWQSLDTGRSWQKVSNLTTGSARNHMYARRPVAAHPEFYALWADGNPRKPSESRLYFCSRDGVVRRLPATMDGESAQPEFL
jgi:hypothetical protein